MDKATIDLGNKTFAITVENQSKKNIYVQKITLNGKPYSKSYIRHSDVIKGGSMVFYMGDTPSKTFGVNKADRPS